MGMEKYILHVSAGGKSSRMRKTLALTDVVGKHLIEIPVLGTSLLGGIIQNACCFREIRIHCNEDNESVIKQKHQNSNVTVVVDNVMSGPLGPLVRELLNNRDMTLGCAGDFYSDFSWSEFLNFHIRKQADISVLISHSSPTLNGARFTLHRSGKITAWERVKETSEEDLINIGAYIISYSKEHC